ncbi:MAG TPA: thioredoxin domain-containing protein [Myxococcales bacterium]|nr:thioredoxin domain-containing protein [Myxococcales bacterium]
MKVHRKLLPWMIAAGAAELLLASWQWYELETIRRGGEAPFCAINAKVSCQTVWTSSMAREVSQALGVPVAGLGVVWGFVATFLALMLWARERTAEPSRGVLSGARLTALAGALSVPVFVAGSVSAGAVCLTCLGTYAVVAAYAALAWLCAERKLPPWRDLAAGATWAGIGTGVVFAVVLLQARALGSSRPTGAEEIHRLSSRVPEGATADEAIAAILQELPEEGRQFIAMARSLYAGAPPVGFSLEPRERWGRADAPLRIVEWTDVRCPHCRDLLAAMAVIKRVVPQGRFSLESRQYPLDSECNRRLKGSDGTGVRCLGARAQICVEGTPEYEDIVSRLFAAQDDLTPEKILQIASSGSVGRAALERCVASPETQQKLQDDIGYAERFQPRGTPVVLMNGKYVQVPFPVFVYVMALAGGNVDLPVFSKLPPPPGPP